MRDPVFQLLHDLAVERMRQEEVEGFTLEGDDALDYAELGRMAAAYALRAAAETVPGHLPIRQVLLHRANLCWPIAAGNLKPHPRRRALVIAAALIMAEIERIDRREGRTEFGVKPPAAYQRARDAAREGQ